MNEIISTELKSDLENIYKTVGDLLNLLQTKDFEGHMTEANELFSLVKFRLADIEGTLQKDIYNCDYLLTKIKTLQVPGK
jgi:hypothetical protein